jgi:phosphoserine phosphatase
VSGSFHELLRPLARDLRADHVIATQLLRDRQGRFTGEVVEPMVGPAKARAVLVDAHKHGIALADSYAYGDHESDFDYLGLVGNPVLVQGAAMGWRPPSGAPLTVWGRAGA